MSFLAPLYLLGVLAVALPVLFHMIRRTPRGRREFSSIMFLEPSPPRITRRSRIEHWLLLLLRALAVCLLALAFARPFWRVTQEQALSEGESRDFVLLLDTSASMRREGVWNEAVGRVGDLIDEMQPWDRAALVTFDVEPQVLVDFQQWTALDPVQRAEAARAALRETSPTWAATNLGRALIDAAERLDAEVTEDEVPRSRTIVVVSDLQAGSRLEALQAYEWPPQVRVRLESVGDDASANNAGLQPFAAAGSASESDGSVRVRITNAEDARREQFTLRWTDEFAATAGSEDSSGDGPHQGHGSTAPTAVTVIVPPGQSRVVSAPAKASGRSVMRLILEGDDHDFDNEAYLPETAPRTLAAAVLSTGREDDPQGLWYYAARALASTPVRAVEVRALSEVLSPEFAAAPDLIVVAASPSVEQAGRLRAFLENGGTVLFVPLSAD
ncbi:MAG: BatA domain-containing protein, partial [Planctomycetaceae bacterium]